MGSAENKLFIAAHRGVREKDILEQCSQIARCGGGRVYFGFVSHPDDWNEQPDIPPALYEWVAGGWAEIAILPAAGHGDRTEDHFRHGIALSREEN